MNRRMSVNFTFMFIIMILGTSVPLFRSSDAISPCASRIVLDDSKKTVEHQNFNDSIVTFTGNVAVTMPMLEDSDSVYFSLTVNSSIFPSSIVPLMVFDRAHHIIEFNFTLLVPFDTPQREKYSISVDGRYGYNLSQMHYTVEPATCIVVIRQYYSLELDCKDKIELRAGNTERIKLNVSNRGNAADRVKIEITNLDQLADRGWKFQLSQDKCGLPANRWKYAPLVIEIPKDEKPGEYKIELVLSSAQAESLGDPSIMDIETITVKVLNNYTEEIVTGAIIAGPIIMLFAIIMIFVQVKRRKERGIHE